MRSIIVISLGLILWAVCLAVPKFLKMTSPNSASRATYGFIALWFAISVFNMWKGIQAGYSLQEELPIFFFIFLTPSAVAFGVKRKFLA